MKKLIGLWGTANVGKSETIRIVYRKLTEMFPEYIFHEKFKVIIPDAGDIRLVIIINGKIIGIESQGDPNSSLLTSLPLFADLNCDIILCATRTRGATVDQVVKLNASYEIKWIEKHGCEDSLKHQENDEIIATQILKIIKDEIN